MSSIDGQRVWQDVLNRLDQRTRENYFRLNVFLPHAEPAIDDISSMPGLRSSVHGHSQFKKDCAEVATALLVSSYYLELTDLPVFFSGKYLCSGSIRSRLSGHACTAASERLLGRDWSFVTDSEVLGHYKGQQDLCPKCSRYCRKVRFTVRHPCEVLTVYIQQDSDSRKRKISGFPRSVRWFLSVQSLDWAFGTPHQDADLNHSCEACTARSTATKRYAHEFAVTEAEQKRPRRV